MNPSEFNPLMGLIFKQTDILGDVMEIEETVRPTDTQYALQPGDKCLAVSTISKIDSDFAMVKILEPDTDPQLWPDWELRVQKSYVLCEYFTLSDHDSVDPLLGWFSRMKLVKIEEERYQESLAWKADGFPDTPPKWMLDKFAEHADTASQNNPAMPRPATCPHCGNRDLDLTATSVVTVKGAAAVGVVDGKEMYSFMGSHSHDQTRKAVLHCPECHSTGVLGDDEWKVGD